ncbi:MAG: HAD family hydrolase [Floccifex sp.]
MKHKIVFFDMDGTLYQTENDIILDSSLEAIQMLKERGYIVCAATGRPLNQLKLILEKITFDYYVTINGGYILDAELNEIDSFPIERQSLNDLVDLCKQNEFGLLFHFGDASYIYNNFYPMYYFCKYCNVLDSLFYDQSQSYHKRHKAFDAVVLTKDKHAIDEFMESHPDLRRDLINVKTDGFCYDIFNKTVDKSHGIEMILKRENLTWKDTICFGDSTNDIGMLQKADIGVAMGTANDYVKSFANFVTTSTYNHGIYNGVKKILNEED